MHSKRMKRAIKFRFVKWKRKNISFGAVVSNEIAAFISISYWILHIDFCSWHSSHFSPKRKAKREKKLLANRVVDVKIYNIYFNESFNCEWPANAHNNCTTVYKSISFFVQLKLSHYLQMVFSKYVSHFSLFMSIWGI